MALDENGLKGEVVSGCTSHAGADQVPDAPIEKEHPRMLTITASVLSPATTNELFRIPDGGKVQIDHAGRHFAFSPRVYIDDYHTRIAGRVHHSVSSR